MFSVFLLEYGSVRSMRIVEAVLAAGLLSCVLPTSLLAAGAKGWVEQGCSFATFHITENALPVGQELIFRLNTEGISLGALPLGGYFQRQHANTSLWVQGQRCSPTGSCDDGTQPAIWLDAMKGGGKRISGRYAVNFGGQHVEGRFVVKYRRIKPAPICE